jgi:hypothetical protein
MTAPYLVVERRGGKQSNHVLFPIVLMLCTMLLLVSLSPISRSAVETSLDTKMDQVDPNTPLSREVDPAASVPGLTPFVVLVFHIMSTVVELPLAACTFLSMGTG